MVAVLMFVVCAFELFHTGLTGQQVRRICALAPLNLHILCIGLIYTNNADKLPPRPPNYAEYLRARRAGRYAPFLARQQFPDCARHREARERVEARTFCTLPSHPSASHACPPAHTAFDAA